MDTALNEASFAYGGSVSQGALAAVIVILMTNLEFVTFFLAKSIATAQPLIQRVWFAQ